MADHNSRIVIIGAGAFGLSTALQLAQKGYNSITVLDRSLPPVADGSSVDISRIIRFDYTDGVYAKLAKEAYHDWVHSGVYSPSFRATPFLMAVQESNHKNVPGRSYLDGNKSHLLRLGQTWTDVQNSQEAKLRFPSLTGQLASPGFDAYVNDSAGWADAIHAITRVRDECIKAGVSFITGPRGAVHKVIYNKDGTVKSVEAADGQIISGDYFILAAGAWSSSLVPLGQATVATAQIVGFLKLTDDEMETLKGLPIYVNLSTGFFNFPPHPETKYLKVACHGFGYTRSGLFNSNDKGYQVSSPPTKKIPGRTNYIPAEGLDRLKAGLVEILGPAYMERDFEKTALCWYTDTPTGDFIIDYHPKHKNLLIANGGSGHAFKFLPILGKYIVQAFENTLESELKKRWTLNAELLEGKRPFVGDGSRGGPPRRELTREERAKL